jgi:hypothetical protein
VSTYDWGAGPGVQQHGTPEAAGPGVPGEVDDVDGVEEYERFLDAPEHAWWASPTTTTEPGTEAGAGAAASDDPAGGSRDHQFGSLGISFELDDPDPYEVLRIPRNAPWEDILTAYRRQVRWWHPDGLGEATDVERDACEDRIRVLNTAYQELRLRRGR